MKTICFYVTLKGPGKKKYILPESLVQIQQKSLVYFKGLIKRQQKNLSKNEKDIVFSLSEGNR